MNDDPSGRETAMQQLAVVREEIRFEIGLLHERVNALLAAEAFLTIASTAAMSNGTSWGATFSLIVSPMLSALGLLLAMLAWPGIDATVRMVMQWTLQQRQIINDNPALLATTSGLVARGSRQYQAYYDQRRSMLFFRAVPVLFTVVWAALTVVAVTIPR